MKVEVENDSHQYSYESRVSGHSTPIRRKEYTYNVEDSPELDYRCSPISLPCTQDGGNEIAWDWQVPGRSSSNENAKTSNSLVETPKRTKQLQKKRNSNSPLLQKPLKRKQVKMENIENIGKLTRELMAITEKMKRMQQTCRNSTTATEDSIKLEDESRLLNELDVDSSDALSEVGINTDKPETGVIPIDSNHKKGPSYEDLFDDSVDDSMIKCSQEVEEKLNLCKSKGNDILIMSTVTEERELSSKSENEILYFTASNNSAESSKNSSVSKSSSSVGASSRLKTYSNNSSKTTCSSNASISSSKDSCFLKPHFINNALNVRENDLSQFPDDSFDDCLATCMEDDKLLSKLAEYDFTVSNADNSLSRSRKTYKQGASNTMNNTKTSKIVGNLYNTKSSSHGNSKLITNDLADDSAASYSSEAIKSSFIGNSPLENRKFFKTKSLSDQYFHQKKPSTVNGTTNQTVSSSDKRFQSNSFNLSVSTTSSTVKGKKLYESNKFPSINGVENTRALNRLEEKDTGNCTVKYKSTSNLYSIKEGAKDSQQVQCTPQEIERKRLEAKIRLEAKRKLQVNARVASTPSEVPVKKSVKR
ncbi:uncharacterized protein LOC143367831 isoform X2 [Andrena cerasifolii]